jgi:cobalt/nickel transport system permease protein
MHLIDRYAYANRIRRVDPAQKAGLAGLVILLCLLLSRPAVGLLAVGWMWGLTVGWAGHSWRLFGQVLLAEGLFLVLAVVGVALSLSLTPPPDQAWVGHVGPLWVSSSPPALETALLLVTRALGSAAAMNFLALTTPLVDLIDLLRRLRVPPLVIDLMTLIYRYIFTLLESLQRMYTAQDARLGYGGWRQRMRSAGLLASRLFVEAYGRSQRLQTALESRGYTGDLRVLPVNYRRDRWVWWFGTGIVFSMLLAWVGL